MRYVVDPSIILSGAGTDLLTESVGQQILASRSLVIDVLARPSYPGAIRELESASREVVHDLAGIWRVSSKRVEQAMNWMLDPQHAPLEEALVAAAEEAAQAIARFRSSSPGNRLFDMLLQESINIYGEQTAKPLSIVCKRIAREQIITAIAESAPILCRGQVESEFSKFLRDAGVRVRETTTSVLEKKQRLLNSVSVLIELNAQLLEQDYRLQAIYIDGPPATLVISEGKLAFELLTIILVDP